MKKLKISKRENNIKVIFARWLNKNIHLFNIKPIEINERTFKFEGVIDNVSLVVDYNLPEIMIFFDSIDENDNYDHLPIEYISMEKYDKKRGYYAADRVDKNYKYYATQEELYINDVFEKLIPWCNENLLPENSLYLTKSGGLTSGFIAPTDEEDNEQLDHHLGMHLFLKENINPNNNKRVTTTVKHKLFLNK